MVGVAALPVVPGGCPHPSAPYKGGWPVCGCVDMRRV